MWAIELAKKNKKGSKSAIIKWFVELWNLVIL